MKTLKIKFNLIEKVKGRDFLLRQEWLERECQEVHEISFSEDEGRKALEDKLNLDICGVLKTTLEKNKDRLRTGTHYITATVKLEEDNKDVGFVIRHFDQTLSAFFAYLLSILSQKSVPITPKRVAIMLQFFWIKAIISIIFEILPVVVGTIHNAHSAALL
ncbi:hypothetical protein [Aggregatibacter actinomycetemcomitans]